ncbi:MAG: hypothetical protein KAT16_02780, partial [Candidatus Heimdallarchaeota archaeon]|nr:hypothetical protein [Candidatus Heimdallarchaeota archaeon]
FLFLDFGKSVGEFSRSESAENDNFSKGNNLLDKKGKQKKILYNIEISLVLHSIWLGWFLYENDKKITINFVITHPLLDDEYN